MHLGQHRGAGSVLTPTGRQLQALRAYVRAGTHEAAGALLGISPRTVQAHLGALRGRLGVHTEAQAVYVLWLGYRDHVDNCDLAEHAGCMPDLANAHREAGTELY